MADIIVILLLAAIIIPAIVYIIKAKKKGQKCIGCPNALSCSKCHCNDSAALKHAQHQV